MNIYEKLPDEIKLPISISTYASDEEKKQIEQTFSSFNPIVEKTYITRGVEQQLLQILVDLSQISINIILTGVIYDLFKKAIKDLYKIKTKKPVLKIKYKEKIIYYDSNNDFYWIFVRDKSKVNYREDFYKNHSLKEVLKLIEKIEDENA